MIDKQAVLAHYRGGEYKTMKAVADKFGCTKAYVETILRQHMEPTRRPPMKPVKPKRVLKSTLHGEPARYQAGCRCEWCTEANTARAVASRRKAQQRRSPPVHGKDSSYVHHGCRCEICTKAHSKAFADYDARRGVKR